MPAHPFVSAPSDAHQSCYVLLDDCDASDAHPRSRLYSNLRTALSCHEVDELPALLTAMQQALNQGLYAVALFSYELGERMHGLQPDRQESAMAQILLFERCERLSATQVSDWLEQQSQADTAHAGPSGIAALRASVNKEDFEQAIARIHAYLTAGDSYQVNYTYRLQFDAYGDLPRLYQRLRARQPVPFGALIALPDGSAVLSLSPELFVRHSDGLLTTCPMKGTAAASGVPAEDQQTAATLAADVKGRAENLMIVDLLRNDLGRIAQLGSVQVPSLFDVQRHGSVLQMTSTVTAQSQDGLTVQDVLNALFPCGSVTGAPKHRTLQIIRELESAPRGIYTGAIGWFDPVSDGRALGDFCLSVPIRTLALSAPGINGVRPGEMGVGAGIVHDSQAQAEYAECQLKAGFLTGLSSDFELFETMHATRNEGCRHLDRHLRRLASSADYFGFRFDEQHIRNALRTTCAGLSSDGAHRLRLALRPDGSIDITTGLLTATHTPVRLLLSDVTSCAADLFLRHKTSVRARYDEAWRLAERHGAFDTLFCNERGELTEGARSNLFLKLDGKWFTPPLSAGLLPGVMRAVLLDDPHWNAGERALTLADLQHAQEIVVCNALRGALSATIDRHPPRPTE